MRVQSQSVYTLRKTDGHCLEHLQIILVTTLIKAECDNSI